VLKILAVGGATLVALSACSAMATYDIDLQCRDNDLSSTYYFQSFLAGLPTDKEGTESLRCALPKYFLVQCDERTVEVVDNTYFCSTHDHKTVRIRLVSPG
jgi:hypothetical protein